MQRGAVARDPQSPQIFAPLQTAKYWTETFAAEKKSSNDEKAALLGGIAAGSGEFPNDLFG